MGIVGKVAPERRLAWHMDEGEAEEERTVERRVRVTAPEPWRFANRPRKRVRTISDRVLAIARSELDNRPTRRMRTISDRVFAIARGELDEEDDREDADDPFGGLIPVHDEEGYVEVDESWLDEHVEPEPFSSRPPEP